jgi:hypothetical protein
MTARSAAMSRQRYAVILTLHVGSPPVKPRLAADKR